MPKLLVTGSAGGLGSECVRHFAALGWNIYGIDNNSRAKFFGEEASVGANLLTLIEDVPGYGHYPHDLTYSPDVTAAVVKDAAPDLIIHAAAQPSHDWAATNPLRDFEVNATATLFLLEAVRKHAPEAAFVFLSTNKVYGDSPNRLPITEMETRYDLAPDTPAGRHGIGEWMSVDDSMHSLFGCSKLAADLYVQEYGRYCGLRTVCFRCGCLTGAAHVGAPQHGFLSYLVQCCREGRPYTIHGYGGKQTRDNLHFSDIASACEAFYHHPRPGAVYNLGGGRANSCSVLEAVAMAEAAVGRKMETVYDPQSRRGDHQVWVTDCGKFCADYPEWEVRVSLPEIFAELAAVGKEATCPVV